MSDPRVAVIGAGPSGLAAAKALVEAGLTPVVFEAQDDVGGNWLYTEEPGHSSVFDTTHIISSKSLSQYSDYPMPAEWPDYPSRRLLIEYFRGYAERFTLRPHIRFRTAVSRATPDAGGWRVTSRAEGGAETGERFDHLLVCSGHHWDPRWPETPGSFTGRLLHSHGFKTARGFEGRRVLVIGGGNSACDCAVEVSRVAAFTAIALRRGYWFMPKLMLGLPGDVLYQRLLVLPPRLRQILVGVLLRVLVGSFARYGLPEPDHRVLECHPTINSELLDKLRHGDVAVRGGIERYEGGRVVFRDGRVEEYDAVIACTGYRITFPFLDPAVASFGDGEVPLFLKVFPPDQAGLYFIGLVQPLGCIWPLAELQSRLVARAIRGTFRLPADAPARIRDDLAHPPFAFMRTPRHAVEVDFHAYRAQLLAALA